MLARRSVLIGFAGLAACGGESTPPGAYALSGWPQTEVDVFTRFAGVWSGGAIPSIARREAPQGGSIPLSFAAEVAPGIRLTVFIEPAPPVREVMLNGPRTPERSEMLRLCSALIAAVSPELNTGQSAQAAEQLAGHVLRRGQGEMTTSNARIGWSPSGADHRGFSIWAVPRGRRRFSEF